MLESEPLIIIDKHIVKAVSKPTRILDYAIEIFPQLMTKNAVKKALKRKELILNSSVAYSGDWINENDEIVLVDNENKIPRKFPLEIEVVFEDDYFIVVNKPSGLLVSGNQFRTLVNAMVGAEQESSQVDALKWVKPVHRLDSATSGLLIMSKTATAHRDMAKLFERREVDKTYHAVVTGLLKPIKGQIDTTINNQKAITLYESISVVQSLRSEVMSLVRLNPETGRTHQLRIHLCENGNPIVGDVLYGEKGNTLLHKGLFLAATSLAFKHPITNEDVEIELDIPHKFNSLLEREGRRWKKFQENS